jgi:2-polyprenyl-3-methyl-5-hydroxy-6-metoxy-1,4-benzoquinol methylase
LNKNLKNLSRICPICSSTVGEVLHTQYFRLPEKYILPSSYDIVCCNKCGFVFADVAATQRDYDTFYADMSKYEDKQTSSGGSFQSWDIERSMRLVSDLSEMITDRKSKIMDIGCANGGLLKALKNEGYQNLVGFDPSPVCISNIKQTGFDGFVGSIFSVAFDSMEQDFDCVILSHVLEHIYDLRKALMKIVIRLKIGGTLYIEVPDASRYQDFYKVPFYYFDCEHINHFAEYSLINLLSQFGLEYLISSKKDIAASPSELYPALYILCRKICDQNYMQEFTFNSVVRNSVVKYIEMSQKDNVYTKLNEIAGSKEKVIVWGAGQNTLRLLSNSPLNKCNLVAFVDKDSKKQGLMFGNITIHSPEIIKGYNGYIIVSSALHSGEIVEEIRNMGLKNKVIVLKSNII